MPYLVLKVLQAKETIPINFDLQLISHLQLMSVQGTGVPFITPLFVTIRNQPLTNIFGNVSSLHYPIPVVSAPDFVHVYSPPMIMMEGDDTFNAAHALEIEVLDINNNPAQFSALILIFSFLQVDQHFPPTLNSVGHNHVAVKEHVEERTRNPNEHIPKNYGHWSGDNNNFLY